MKTQNKFKLALLASCLTAATSAHADMILGVYAGAQYWNIEPEGKFGSSDDGQEEFNFSSASNATFYVALEHPIPLVPNIKLRRNQMEDLKGNGTFTANFNFAGTTYQAQEEVSAIADLSNTDYILYYELFDNGLLSFDFGLNVKHIDGTINTDGTDFLNNGQPADGDQQFDEFIPMGYVAAAVGLPLTGLSIYGDMSLLAIGDHSLSDYQVGIAYEFIDNLAVDMEVQLGYRSFALKLDDLEGIHSDLDFKGVYAGLQVHF